MTVEAPKEQKIDHTSTMAGCNRVVNILLVLLGIIFSLVAGWFVSKRVQDLRVPSLAIIVVSILSVGMIASLRVKRIHRPKILMTMLSILTTIYLFEGFLSSFGNPLDYDNDRFIAALTHGKMIDKRMAIDVFIDMKDAGEEVSLALPATELLNKGSLPLDNEGKLIFPIGNIANTKVVYCNELGDHITYETDEYGFHNPQGIWQNPIDIAIIGDSFANGACVPSEKNGVAHIREQYPRTVTVGSSGSGSLLELAALKEYVMPFKPPLVLWWYFEGNDILDIQSEKQDNFIAQYLDSDFSQNLIDRQSDIDKVRYDYVDNIEQLRRDEIVDATDIVPADSQSFHLRRFISLFQLRRLLKIDFLPLDLIETTEQSQLSPRRARLSAQSENDNETAKGEVDTVDVNDDSKETPQEATARKALESRQHYLKSIEELPDNLSILKRTLTNARDTVHEWGGDFIVVYIPQWERYEFETEDWTFQRREVQPLLDDLAIPVIDLKKAMDAHEDPLSLYPFRINGHYNAAGYQFMADVIMAELETYDEHVQKK